MNIATRFVFHYIGLSTPNKSLFSFSMTVLLKDYISKEFVTSLANSLAKIDKKGFINDVEEERESLELKDRTKLIARELHQHLPGAYSEKIEQLSGIVSNYNGLQALVFTEFIEIFGLDDYQTSIKAIELFTQHGTAEFTIRPFIEKYPETMRQLLKWSQHENYHVRRLASEGCRPRLPWAGPLRGFISDPSPLLPILENLIDDKEDYVYRSVANNLNDISKDHPELAIEFASKWIDSSESSKWAVKHGMRTLLKQGHPDCFKLFNYGEKDDISIQEFSTDQDKVQLGESCKLNLELSLKQSSEKKFRIDYIVHYVKNNGKSNPKVFSFRENTLNKGLNSFSKKLDFKPLSTRKYYSGVHKIDLVVNGSIVDRCEVDLIRS